MGVRKIKTQLIPTEKRREGHESELFLFGRCGTQILLRKTQGYCRAEEWGAGTPRAPVTS